ncbi:MAG: F0F1 ATP synthase subunit A [Deltaproteobacteria bacterium]|nr:F0F1 ATP synthase subunit A [Deltaproteobacteria bacterium]
MKKIKTLSILSLCNLVALFSASPSFASEEGGFTWLSLLPFWEYISSLEHHTGKICDFGNINVSAIGHSLLVSIILIGIAVYVKRTSPPKIVPSDKVTMGNILEAVVEFVCSLIDDNMGREGRKFIYIIGAVFIFVLLGNLIGLIPGFLPPTENININAGCAIIVFFSYQVIGFREHGLSYLKHFAGPIWWLAPFMFVIEIVGHLARPFSLSIRLFGNIMGDHKVLEIFSNLVPLGVPVFNLALGTFVSAIQALVFSLLSIIYISLAVEPGEH